MSLKIKEVRLGCGVLIINNKREVLLLKRLVKSRDEHGFWSQPGGAVDYGETVEHTIKREIK